MKTIRIGSGAGYSGDRIEPAVELAEKGNLDYLVFECLAERTIAIAQQARMNDPSKGYDPLLADRMQAVLRQCHDRKIRIITNMGAANPQAGAQKVTEIARSLGIKKLKVAAVSGDDVLAELKAGDYRLEETGQKVSDLGNALVSANAYLGAEGIIKALEDGADVIITGRVSDPSLFLAPQIFEFGWDRSDWDKIGKGTILGHLLECAGQVTGGYFADPGVKDVPGLARLGFPLAEISEDGTTVITKVADSGGMVTDATCKEQMLYELHEPTAYLTPDVTADFSSVSFRQVGINRVQVGGGAGGNRPETLKVSVGYVDSYVGEGQMSYAGPGAVARARLALDIVRERLALTGVQTTELRFDIIGINSIHGDSLSEGHDPYEVRIRVVGRTENMKEAQRIGNEVETLYTNGPAGGGGAFKAARQIVAMGSAYIPRAKAAAVVEYLEI